MQNSIPNKILPGLTTTSGSDWKEKIQEIDSLEISEISFFPTKLTPKERKYCYSLLEKSRVRRIPHIHLRNDMEEWEIKYLIKNFKTEVFNTHPESCQFSFDLKKAPEHVSKIFIENIRKIPTEKEIKNSGGICIDFSHWENAKKVNCKDYEDFGGLVEKYPIGCCHVSAIGKELKIDKDWHGYDSHWAFQLSDLDYVKKYVQYLPKYVSLELENPFKEQLEFKKYLEKIIYETRK